MVAIKESEKLAMTWPDFISKDPTKLVYPNCGRPPSHALLMGIFCDLPITRESFQNIYSDMD